LLKTLSVYSDQIVVRLQVLNDGDALGLYSAKKTPSLSFPQRPSHVVLPMESAKKGKKEQKG